MMMNSKHNILCLGRQSPNKSQRTFGFHERTCGFFGAGSFIPKKLMFFWEWQSYMCENRRGWGGNFYPSTCLLIVQSKVLSLLPSIKCRKMNPIGTKLTQLDSVPIVTAVHWIRETKYFIYPPGMLKIPESKKNIFIFKIACWIIACSHKILKNSQFFLRIKYINIININIKNYFRFI
jgi:hypothetical protein